MENEKHNLINLSQSELDNLKEQLLESIYADIGRSIVKKVLWILGAISLAGLAWISGKGHF